MLKRQRDGTLRKHWYGVYTDDKGKRRVLALATKIAGTPPVSGSLSDPGDGDFEASRQEAENELKGHAVEARQKGRADHLLERLIEAKTGTPVEYARIADLADLWLGLPRDAKPTAPYVSGVKSAFGRFEAFMAENHASAVYLYEVTVAHAGAFAEALRRDYAPMTARAYFRLLRGAFARFLPAGWANPFVRAITRRSAGSYEGSVHRVPFRPEELAAVLEAAREYEDGVLYGPVVASACCALRRGDACRLDWASVDLSAGLVSVKTHKTGERVEIPLLSPLRTILEGVGNVRKGPCFPVAARMLVENPDGLTWRFKRIVARALAAPGMLPGSAADPAAIESAGLTAMATLPAGRRREHMEKAFRGYMAGASVAAVAREMGVSKGSVSGWLSAVSGMIGTPVIRGSEASMSSEVQRITRVARESGQRAASIRDWHALRTSWVTLALSAGVPVELVRRVTGHRTVEVVLQNYFRPGREDLRAVISKALPTVLTGTSAAASGATPAQELADLAGKAAAGTVTAQDRRRLRELAAMV